MVLIFTPFEIKKMLKYKNFIYFPELQTKTLNITVEK
jgi:hypothetical protein